MPTSGIHGPRAPSSSTHWVAIADACRRHTCVCAHVAAVPAVSGRTDEEKEMSMQDRRRPPRGRVETETHRPPTAKELANLHKLALQWRDEWRVKASGGMPSRTPTRKAG